MENVCGPVLVGGPADIAKQPSTFQALKLSIRHNLSLTMDIPVFLAGLSIFVKSYLLIINNLTFRKMAIPGLKSRIAIESEIMVSLWI